jgi:hypothetical protein
VDKLKKGRDVMFLKLSIYFLITGLMFFSTLGILAIRLWIKEVTNRGNKNRIIHESSGRKIQEFKPTKWRIQRDLPYMRLYRKCKMLQRRIFRKVSWLWAGVIEELRSEFMKENEFSPGDIVRVINVSATFDACESLIKENYKNLANQFIKNAYPCSGQDYKVLHVANLGFINRPVYIIQSINEDRIFIVDQEGLEIKKRPAVVQYQQSECEI